MKTWLVLNDLQVPFQDKPVVRSIIRFARALKPDGLILNGDIADCYEISDFDKNPLQEAGLDREVRETGAIMADLSFIRQKVWKGGNHEDRLRRFFWKHRDEWRVLGRRGVEMVSETVDFAKLFNLDAYGFRWVPYDDLVPLGKLMVAHGTIVRQHSAYSARAHQEKYGMSVLHGHTHRMGQYFATNLRGVHAGYENGCLCRLDPEYVQHPNWQQGFAVVHVDEATKFFNVQQVPILQRRVFFYGSERWDVK